MPEHRMVLVNRLGLHARASARVTQLLGAFRSGIQIEFRGRSVNGKSILGLMTLAAPCGSELRVTCEGPDADQAAQALATLIADRFGEPE